MANIIVKVGGDARAFKRTMRGLSGEAKSAGRQIGANLIGPLAGAGAVAGLTAMTKAALDAADAIGKGATKLGVSTDEYQRLGEMANRAGASHESMTAAVARMSRVVVDAADGTKEGVDALAAIGYQADQLKGKKPEEIFQTLATAIASIEDPTERLARAQEVFGRGAKDLMPMILNFEELRGEVEATQTLMGEDAVRAAERFNDSVGQIGSNIRSGLVNSGLIEWLASVTDGLNEISAANKQVEAGLVQQESAWRKWTDIVVASQKNTLLGFAAEKFLDRADDVGGGRVTVSTGPATGADVAAAKARAATEAADEADRKRLAAAAAISGQLERDAQAQAKIDAAAQKARDKATAATDAQIDTLAERVRLQKLVNQGLDREAAIEKAIADAKRRNADLTAQQAQDVRSLAGELFDLKNTTLSEAVDAITGIPATRETDTTALERIGAIMGGVRSPQRDRVQSEILNQNKQQTAQLTTIADKIEPAQIGSV